MINNKFCIMPMMGDGRRFQREGYNVSKPLIEIVSGYLLLEKVFLIKI